MWFCAEPRTTGFVSKSFVVGVVETQISQGCTYSPESVDGVTCYLSLSSGTIQNSDATTTAVHSLHWKTLKIQV